MAHMHLYQVVMEVRQCQGPDAACLLAWHAWGGSIHAHLQGMSWVNGFNKRCPSWP